MYLNAAAFLDRGLLHLEINGVENSTVKIEKAVNHGIEATKQRSSSRVVSLSVSQNIVSFRFTTTNETTNSIP